MSRFSDPLQYVKLPEMITSLSLAALSLPCYRAANDQRDLAERLKAEYPSQSEYIQNNAALPQALGNTLAGTAAVVLSFSFRNPRRRDEDPT